MPFQRLTYLKNNKIQTVPTGHLCVICHHFIRLMSRLAMLLVRILINRTSNFKVTFQTITSYENYCVWPQHLFSKRTNHKLRKKLPNQKCHKDNYMEFEHNTVHKFADTLYRWFRVSAMQVMFFIIRRSKKLVTNA